MMEGNQGLEQLVRKFKEDGSMQRLKTNLQEFRSSITSYGRDRLGILSFSILFNNLVEILSSGPFYRNEAVHITSPFWGGAYVYYDIKEKILGEEYRGILSKLSIIPFSAVKYVGLVSAGAGLLSRIEGLHQDYNSLPKILGYTALYVSARVLEKPLANGLSALEEKIRGPKGEK